MNVGTELATAVACALRLSVVASKVVPALSSAIFLRLSAMVAPPLSMSAGVPMLTFAPLALLSAATNMLPALRTT